MQYFLCPRCKFKISGASRICSTCGYQIVKMNPATSSTPEIKEEPKKRASLLSRFFGLDNNKPAEGGTEKHALG